MKTRVWFAVALVGACLSASSVSAQDPAAEDVLPLTLKLMGGSLAADGAIEYQAGATVQAVVAAADPSLFLVGALYIAPAASVGDFQLLDQGLVLLGAFDAQGRLDGFFHTYQGLAGLMVAGRAYAFDGQRIVESPIRTVRFL